MARVTYLHVIALLVLPSVVFATQYVVGDDEGWNSGVDYYAWVEGKTFYAGDSLAFNYNAGAHNVVVVDANGYDQCLASPNNGAYNSGQDVLTFNVAGDYYFICEWHCNHTDQKLKVTVNYIDSLVYAGIFFTSLS